MKTKDLHSWNLSYRQAAALQKRLAPKVRFIPFKKEPELIAGIDCAFSRDGEKIIAVAVVLKVSDFEIVETKSAVRDVAFPYIPGFLSFREGPVCIAAVEKLKSRSDLFIVDGQGIAHPRRLGLAAHLGLFLDKPTVGCAKSRLTGTFEEPGVEKGSYSFLKDKKRKIHKEALELQVTENEIIGAVVRTRSNVKPVFVSVGNKCLLDDAIKIILACAARYRLPEPTRLAHQTVSRLRLKY